MSHLHSYSLRFENRSQPSWNKHPTELTRRIMYKTLVDTCPPEMSHTSLFDRNLGILQLGMFEYQRVLYSEVRLFYTC